MRNQESTLYNQRDTLINMVAKIVGIQPQEVTASLDAVGQTLKISARKIEDGQTTQLIDLTVAQVGKHKFKIAGSVLQQGREYIIGREFDCDPNSLARGVSILIGEQTSR